MPRLHYGNDALPEPDEFRRQLREASEQYDPVDELLSLERELADRERLHGLSSAEFHTRYLKGETSDMPEFVEWAGLYEGSLNLKIVISESLKLIVSDPVAD